VVVQAPDVVALDEGAGAAAVLEDEEGAAGALVEGAVAVVPVAELPAVEDTFEPAGVAGDGGGACLAVTVVSRGAVMVVSGRTVADFDALRTLSVGRAGEADRAVARRTCSIIADQAAGRSKRVRRTRPAVPSDSRRSDDPANAPYRWLRYRIFATGPTGRQIIPNS
jgi:hypothetical protein